MDRSDHGHTVTVSWGRHYESMESSAQRLSRMIEDLAHLHPAFAQWKRLGYSRPSAQKPFCAMPPTIDELARIFKRGQEYSDDRPRVPLPEFGHTAIAWNGTEGPFGCQLRVRAGQHLNNHPLGNDVQIEGFESCRKGDANFFSPQIVEAAFRIMIAAWEPVWGTVSHWIHWCGLLKNLGLDTDPKETRKRGTLPDTDTLGWMIYASAPFVPHIRPPPSATVRETPDGGVILMSTEEPFSFSNPAHVAAAFALRDSLSHINPYTVLGLERSS